MRPGVAPPLPRGRRSRRPTPRYAVIPRWGLADRVVQIAPTGAKTKAGSSATAVRITLCVTLLVFCIAALAYSVRYVLLVVNRNTLLNSLMADAADWLGDAASIAAVVAVIASVVMLIQWLIARRAAAFKRYTLPEHRPLRQLLAGCLVPLVNLLWAPVYLIELAKIEHHYARLRAPIVVWWITWVFSYAASIYAIVTSFAADAQGIATNTIWMVIAYLFAAATVVAVVRVLEGFELKPVERSVHRWLVVGDGRPTVPASASAVEFEGQEPAA